MAMILDAFMSKFTELLAHMLQDEVGMLFGVPDEIEKLQHTVGDIQSVIADAGKRQTESMFIKRWLMELKDVMYDADDIMDLCQIKAEERLDRSNPPCSSKISCGFLHFLSCFRNPFFAHKIGTKIKEINSRLEEIAKRKSDLGLIAIPIVGGPPPVGRVGPLVGRKTDSSVVIDDIVGEKIEEDAGHLVSWLTEEKTGVKENICIVAIVGMGGIGKTTLAKMIYNDSKIDEEFKLKIWACVSKEAKEKDLLACIIRVAGGTPGASQEISELVDLLHNIIKGKKFFLVLDDVWPESVVVWNERLRAPMSGGAHGSRLLITTRNDSVANAIRATKSHRVEKMSDKDGWSLLIKQVFQDEEESEIAGFKDIGLLLVQKCDGLPLGIKSIGGVLRMKDKPTREEWGAILRSDIWSMNDLSKEFPQAFYLSYEDLPPHLKSCFIFCSLYPEDSLFNRTSLIYLWLAEGFLQGDENSWDMGIKYYNELLIRNLLEVSGEYYDKSASKMHDLLRSFAHHLGKDENYILTEGKNLNRKEYVAKLRRLLVQGNKLNLEDVKKEKGLRTLLIDQIPDNSLVDLCTSLPNLRILDMSFSSISTLPDSLSSLVHLRYLDASHSNVRTIPKSIGYLRNLVFLDFTDCKELQLIPHSITNLVKLMFLSFAGSNVEGIPIGMKSLKKLKELNGFKSSKNSLEMFASLDELGTLSHLVVLWLECLEKVTDKHTAQGAKLSCKDQLQNLSLKYTELSWEDQVSQTDEKKATTEGVLNELCPSTSVQILSIGGYFGSTLPYWLNLGTALPNLRFLEIINCNCFVHLAHLGQLPNLDHFLIEYAYSIMSIGEEFLWGDVKSRDVRTQCCSVVPAFPKLNELVFEGMAKWKEWQWNKGESAMPKLKQLFIKDCPQLRFLPEGLVHHTTSLEFLQIYGADNLTIVENFTSINEFRIIGNPNLERISNLLCVSYLLIVDCPNLKTVENLNALQKMELINYEMDALPEYLLSVMPCKLLTIDCSEELLRKITSQGESASEWHKFKHICKVTINSWDKPLYATYQKTPFSFTTNIN